MTKEEAIRLRAAMVTAAESLDDKTASTAPHMFRRLTGDGSLVKAGTRINWNGQVKKAAADLWDREDQDPDHATTIWTDLDYVDGVRKIPDTITATLAFAKGELGWRNGVIYKSLVDGNVWTPEVYAAAWEVVT